MRAWSEAGGEGGRYVEVALCWARQEADAVRVAHERFAFSVLGWKLTAELPTTASFEEAVEHVRPDDVRAQVPCGPDPERHVAAVRRALEAGFDHPVLVGIGPDQEGFLSFFQQELAPRLRRL